MCVIYANYGQKIGGIARKSIVMVMNTMWVRIGGMRNTDPKN